MAKLTRRTALAALATGTGLLGVGYLLRNIIDTPSGHANGPGMRGVSGTDMSRYMNMFMRHGELRRSVVDIPGGIRTTTESDSRPGRRAAGTRVVDVLPISHKAPR